jgi:hypothetical protein
MKPYKFLSDSFGVQHSTISYDKDHGRTSGPTKALSRYRSRRAALRREQLENSSARPIPWGMKAVRRPDRHEVEAPFTKAIIDITGKSPQRIRNGDKPVGRLGRAALRREQCDITTERRNRGTRKGGHC